jgi:hypothetical protein
MSELRDRIIAVLEKHAAAEYSWGVDGCQCGAETEDRQAQHQADAVIAELGAIPDREFDDPWGHHWEWCGGVTGTWAWRVTRLEGRR